jgi:MFS family permease
LWFNEIFELKLHISLDLTGWTMLSTKHAQMPFSFLFFFLQGFCFPVLNQTLVHMEYFFNASTATLSIAVTLANVGGLLGSILCGFVFDVFNHELTFVIASFLQGVPTILAPNMGGIVPFTVAVCTQAIAIGFIAASESLQIT